MKSETSFCTVMDSSDHLVPHKILKYCVTIEMEIQHGTQSSSEISRESILNWKLFTAENLPYVNNIIGLTCATRIHLSMILALWFGEDDGVEGEVEGQSSEVMTRLVTALNWEMVARMVCERFSFLSLWDHTQPRHWKGTTFTKSSYKTREKKVIVVHSSIMKN